MNTSVTVEKLQKYFSITKEALDKAEKALDQTRIEQARDFLSMAAHYCDDAHYFFEKGEYVNAFACLNYAHGWLDAGARIRLFQVNDSHLFTVDEEEEESSSRR